MEFPPQNSECPTCSPLFQQPVRIRKCQQRGPLARRAGLGHYFSSSFRPAFKLSKFRIALNTSE